MTLCQCVSSPRHFKGTTFLENTKNYSPSDSATSQKNLNLQQRCSENLKYRRKCEVNGIVPPTSQVIFVLFCITPGRLCYISYLEINAHINEKPVQNGNMLISYVYYLIGEFYCL